MHDEKQGTIHTISKAALLLGSVRRELPDAVPPLGTSLQPSSFGWITGACAEPAKGDHYIVEFIDKRTYRMLAYIDRHGRVFATDNPLTSPPAREPDVSFARFSEQSVPGEQHGCVEVIDADGLKREVAQYVCKREHYTLFDSWYNFGPMGTNLSYDDVLARAYLAFAYRPTLSGSEVPARGIGLVRTCLQNESLVVGLKDLVENARAAESDPLVNPPALVRSIVRWLGDAGMDALITRKVPSDALRLVRTVRYADMFFIALGDEEKSLVSRREIWALESALNRFLLVEEVFSKNASLASEADCARWDAYLIETVGMQTPSVEYGDSQPHGVEGGEWETRCRISAALERLKLPVRVEVQMRVVAAEGVVALDLTAPDARLMPAWRWEDGSVHGLVEASEAERDAQARRYAMHVGLVLASAAFEASAAIQQVEVTARPLATLVQQGRTVESSNPPEGQRAEFPSECAPAYFQVMLTRQTYETTGKFSAAAAGDPTSLFVYVGASFDLLDVDPFASGVASKAAARDLLPETADATLPVAAQSVLGAKETRALRIVTDAYQRRIGEGLADGIVGAENTTEAIRLVRDAQDAAEVRGDDRAVAAGTRLMAALAEDSLDAGDQNAIVSCFLGEDRCLAALVKARGLAQIDPEQAVSVLMDAVAEAAALDGFVDSPTTVYRSFESYATRVLYNRAVAAAQQRTALGVELSVPVTIDVPTLASCAAADASKRLVMVSDSFYLCHLEIVSLLERSFERIDDAMRYGRRAVEMAPSTAAGYRQLGRAFMLVGDMDNAAAVLEAGLCVAMQPNDIAVVYYQLAYALWKAGRPREGAACYLKSVMTSPVFGLQAMSELKELVSEHDIEPIDSDEVDDELRKGGIVVAPTNEVLEMLNAGAVAATDAGLFPVARNLLSLRLRYLPDDALANVLTSLDSSAI